MSRVFKPKVVPSKLEAKKSEKIQVKVEPRAKKLNLGVMLVEETPEKPRVLSASLSAAGGSLAFGQPKFGFGLLPTNGNGKTTERAEPPPSSPLAFVNEKEDDGDGEEEWMMDSSPDVVLLNPSSKRRGVNDEMVDEEDGEKDEDELMMATPSKPSRAGRGRKRIR
jgi:hypothetical protein